MRRKEFMEFTGLTAEDMGNLQHDKILPRSIKPDGERKWGEYPFKLALDTRRAVELARRCNLSVAAGIRVVQHVDKGGTI